MKNSVLIYGFGRMGITHYAILNQIMSDTSFTIVDPDKKLNLIIGKNLDAKVVKEDTAFKQPFDYTLICTPPMFHIPTAERSLKRGDKNIFIEKPFGGNPDDYSVLKGSENKCNIGYVLRFNPIIQWIKKNINEQDIHKVEGSYYSNTIEEKPKGWRNGTYSGVTNEMGSHIIDLMVYLYGFNKPVIKNIKVESKISDIDDIVDIQSESDGIEFNFHFDWINKAYRKPVFQLKIYLKDDTKYIVDQQSIEIFKGDQLQKKITMVDLAPKTPYYLRGVDFTNQMMDFVGQKAINATVEEALKTRNFIREILKQ